MKRCPHGLGRFLETINSQNRCRSFKPKIAAGAVRTAERQPARQVAISACGANRQGFDRRQFVSKVQVDQREIDLGSIVALPLRRSPRRIPECLLTFAFGGMRERIERLIDNWLGLLWGDAGQGVYGVYFCGPLAPHVGYNTILGLGAIEADRLCDALEKIDGGRAIQPKSFHADRLFETRRTIEEK